MSTQENILFHLIIQITAYQFKILHQFLHWKSALQYE